MAAAEEQYSRDQVLFYGNALSSPDLYPVEDLHRRFGSSHNFGGMYEAVQTPYSEGIDLFSSVNLEREGRVGLHRLQSVRDLVPRSLVEVAYIYYRKLLLRCAFGLLKIHMYGRRSRRAAARYLRANYICRGCLVQWHNDCVVTRELVKTCHSRLRSRSCIVSWLNYLHYQKYLNEAVKKSCGRISFRTRDLSMSLFFRAKKRNLLRRVFSQFMDIWKRIDVSPELYYDFQRMRHSYERWCRFIVMIHRAKDLRTYLVGIKAMRAIQMQLRALHAWNKEATRIATRRAIIVLKVMLWRSRTASAAERDAYLINKFIILPRKARIVDAWYRAALWHQRTKLAMYRHRIGKLFRAWQRAVRAIRLASVDMKVDPRSTAHYLPSTSSRHNAASLRAWWSPWFTTGASIPGIRPLTAASIAGCTWPARVPLRERKLHRASVATALAAWHGVVIARRQLEPRLRFERRVLSLVNENLDVRTHADVVLRDSSPVLAPSISCARLTSSSASASAPTDPSASLATPLAHNWIRSSWHRRRSLRSKPS